MNEKQRISHRARVKTPLNPGCVRDKTISRTISRRTYGTSHHLVESTVFINGRDAVNRISIIDVFKQYIALYEGNKIIRGDIIYELKELLTEFRIQLSIGDSSYSTEQSLPAFYQGTREEKKKKEKNCAQNSKKRVRFRMVLGDLTLRNFALFAIPMVAKANERECEGEGRVWNVRLPRHRRLPFRDVWNERHVCACVSQTTPPTTALRRHGSSLAISPPFSLSSTPLPSSSSALS